MSFMFRHVVARHAWHVHAGHGLLPAAGVPLDGVLDVCPQATLQACCTPAVTKITSRLRIRNPPKSQFILTLPQDECFCKKWRLLLVTDVMPGKIGIVIHCNR